MEKIKHWTNNRYRPNQELRVYVPLLRAGWQTDGDWLVYENLISDTKQQCIKNFTKYFGEDYYEKRNAGLVKIVRCTVVAHLPAEQEGSE